MSSYKKIDYAPRRRLVAGENDLATVNPDLAAQWHPTLNGELTPQMVTAGSNKYVYWSCQRGHVWETQVNHRTDGTDCPYCAGKKVITGETDLATVNPDLAAQWHPTLNGDLTPQMVSARSSKRVYWSCKNGHVWEAKIYHRTNGSDCPYCAGKQVAPGETDLATVNPDLAAQWHPTLNGDLTPQMVSARSSKRVYWSCKNGHVWEAKIYHRTNGSDCPYCAGKQVAPGETDLATVNPDLAAQWHPTLNGDLTPQMVSEGSSKRVFWTCEKGHVWATNVNNRTKGNDCPYCSGNKVISGETDLATVNSALAEEWHPTLNGELTPQMVTVCSGKRVYWSCKKGHVWAATVINRTKNGDGCPFCSRRRPVLGETDLATVSPDLAKEWHPTLNGDLSPEMISAKSNKRVYWSCKKGHAWEATVDSRTNGANCPYCTGRRAVPGETDLATVNPDLAKEWHPTLNGELTPQKVTASSNNRVYWLCKNNHVWKATVANRATHNSCPYCFGRKKYKSQN